MKILLLICLVAASSTVAARPPAKKCPKFSSDYVVSRSLSVEEVERYEMLMLTEMTKIRSDLPPVPFGFGNAEWNTFKSQMRPGDKLVHYSSDERSWQHLAGVMGYAIIRAGCVLAELQTMQN